jgi:Uma2 family endonuclease
MSQSHPSRWKLDPDDPRAPSQAEWDDMSEAERQAVLDALPPDMPLDLHPPEGDAHRKAKQRPVDALEAFFRKLGRRVYVSSELVTYYPGEARFCPDLLAVLDVDPHERDSWNVSREQRGLDLVLEVHWKGHAEKDFETNVERYARLGITEYFVYDRSRYRLLGHRLPDADRRWSTRCRTPSRAARRSACPPRR